MKTAYLWMTALILLVIAAGSQLWQRNAQAQSLNSADIMTLYQRIDTLSASIERTNSQINAKLDTILRNQESIIKELGIIKMRATMK